MKNPFKKATVRKIPTVAQKNIHIEALEYRYKSALRIYINCRIFIVEMDCSNLRTKNDTSYYWLGNLQKSLRIKNDDAKRIEFLKREYLYELKKQSN